MEIQHSESNPIVMQYNKLKHKDKIRRLIWIYLCKREIHTRVTKVTKSADFRDVKGVD